MKFRIKETMNGFLAQRRFLFLFWVTCWESYVLGAVRRRVVSYTTKEAAEEGIKKYTEYCKKEKNLKTYHL